MNSLLRSFLVLGLLATATGCGLDAPSEGCPDSKASPAPLKASPRQTAAFQRRVLAFYYPWFGTPTGPSGAWRHWNPNLRQHGVAHTPQSGFYDSKDSATIRRHVQQAKAAGIDTLIASWWGADLFEDQALNGLLAEAQAQGMAVSVLVEQGLTCIDLRNHLRYLTTRRTGHPAWLREGGRPVIFLYGRVVNGLSPAEFRSILDEFDLFTVADTVGKSEGEPFDGVFVYNPAANVPDYLQRMPEYINRHRPDGRLFMATVLPGYDDTLIRQPGLRVDREGGALYRRMWNASGTADWVVITSWNEWQEGSEIEASVQHGSAYLDLTRTLGQTWRLK